MGEKTINEVIGSAASVSETGKMYENTPE